MPNTQSSFPGWCQTQISAAPGKSAALGGLAVVLVVITVVQLRGGAAATVSGAVPGVVAAGTVIVPPTVPVRVEPRRTLPPLRPSLTRDLFAAEWLVEPVEPPGADPDGTGDKKPPPDEDDQSPPALSLEATYLFGAMPLAIINGRTVRVGDRIERYVVETIEGRYVVLNRNGRQLRLNMP